MIPATDVPGYSSLDYFQLVSVLTSIGARPSSPVRQDGERRTTFLDEYAFRRVPFFSLRVPSIDRPSQGVKTLKNNAIIIMTVIILLDRVERKPDVVAFED